MLEGKVADAEKLETNSRTPSITCLMAAPFMDDEHQSDADNTIHHHDLSPHSSITMPGAVRVEGFGSSTSPPNSQLVVGAMDQAEEGNEGEGVDHDVPSNGMEAAASVENDDYNDDITQDWMFRSPYVVEAEQVTVVSGSSEQQHDKEETRKGPWCITTTVGRTIACAIIMGIVVAIVITGVLVSNSSQSNSSSSSSSSTSTTAGVSCGNGNIGNGVCADSSLCCSQDGKCGIGNSFCSGDVGNHTHPTLPPSQFPTVLTPSSSSTPPVLPPVAQPLIVQQRVIPGFISSCSGNGGACGCGAGGDGTEITLNSFYGDNNDQQVFGCGGAFHLDGASWNTQWQGQLGGTGISFSQSNSYDGWEGCCAICGFNLQLAGKLSDGWFCQKDFFATGIWLKGKNKH